MSYQNLDVFLRERGIKASYQRVRILDYMRGTKSHPSAAKIYQDLHPQIPSLSLATVYNTLNLFVEKGLITELKVEGDEARYDFPYEPHAHFVCTECGTIYDVPMGVPQACMDMEGFLVKETQIVFRGVCPSCQHRN